MSELSPSDLMAMGHMPAAHTENDEWDGCGCCGWCTVVMECSCGWEYETGGTMTRGGTEEPTWAYEEWLLHAKDHIKTESLSIPSWLSC